jgi:hypothetical protein
VNPEFENPDDFKWMFPPRTLVDPAAWDRFIGVLVRGTGMGILAGRVDPGWASRVAFNDHGMMLRVTTSFPTRLRRTAAGAIMGRRD